MTTTQLEQLTQAERMLAGIATAKDAVDVIAFAEAARVWAQQARLGTSAVNHATVIKMRAERRLADAVDEGQKQGQIATKESGVNQHQGVRPADTHATPPPSTLGDIGVDRKRLHEARKIRDSYTDDDLIDLQRQADEQDEVLSRKELIRSPTNAQRMQSSESNEWYTPARYIEAARLVLGGIDLDPASSARANETVQAARIFTKDDDGLNQPWKGRVWMNPPYGGLAGRFVARMADAYEDGDIAAGICLVSSHSTDTEWFRPLWERLLCFTYGRIHFTSSDGKGQDAATHGSVFAYFGDDEQGFMDAFGEFGAVMTRWA